MPTATRKPVRVEPATTSTEALEPIAENATPTPADESAQAPVEPVEQVDESPKMPDVDAALEAIRTVGQTARWTVKDLVFEKDGLARLVLEPVKYAHDNTLSKIEHVSGERLRHPIHKYLKLLTPAFQSGPEMAAVRAARKALADFNARGAVLNQEKARLEADIKQMLRVKANPKPLEAELLALRSEQVLLEDTGPGLANALAAAEQAAAQALADLLRLARTNLHNRLAQGADEAKTQLGQVVQEALAVSLAARDAIHDLGTLRHQDPQQQRAAARKAVSEMA